MLASFLTNQPTFSKVMMPSILCKPRIISISSLSLLILRYSSKTTSFFLELFFTFKVRTFTPFSVKYAVIFVIIPGSFSATIRIKRRAFLLLPAKRSQLMKDTKVTIITAVEPILKHTSQHRQQPNGRNHPQAGSCC